MTAEWGRGMGLEHNSQPLELQKINPTSPPWKGAYITKNQDSHRSDLIESSLPAPQALAFQARERVTCGNQSRRSSA